MTGSIKMTDELPECPIPCRSQEFENIISFIKQNVVQKISRCMYISGVPGSGKTITVNAAINELKAHYQDQLKFKDLYVNGLTLGQRSDNLWKKMKSGLEIPNLKRGRKRAANVRQKNSTTLDSLDAYFNSDENMPTVLVIDELDQLIDKLQTVLYRLLEWTTNPIAKFTFIAIFNTNNLPELALLNRNTSRMGLCRLVFSPYDHVQLREIVEKSLLQNSERSTSAIDGDALTLLSRKVAAISGDARRALEIAKRTLEIIEESKAKKATTKTVDRAFKELFSSPKIETIRDCTTLEKTILDVIASELNSKCLEEIHFGPIQQSVLDRNAFDGMNVSTDNIIAALTRLTSLKLINVDTTHPFFYGQTKISMNIPFADVRFALIPMIELTPVGVTSCNLQL